MHVPSNKPLKQSARRHSVECKRYALAPVLVPPAA